VLFRSLAPGSEVEALADHLADLSGLSFINDIISDDIIERVDGRIVGIPYAFEGFGFVYNRDLYQSGDFADVNSLIAKMQRDQTVGLSGESFFLIGHILNAPFALQADPEAFMEAVIAGEQTLHDVPEFQDFARLYAAIRDYSYNPLEMDYSRQMGGLATGTIGAVHQGNWSWGMLADYDMDFEVAMAPVPLLGNDALSVSVPSVWAINADVSAAEIQAGIDFLNWLYTSETGQRYLFEEFGFLPVLYGVESPSVDPLSAEVLRFVEEGRTIIWATNFYPAGIVDVHLVPVAEAFFTTDMTEEALLIAIQEAFMAAGN
jgi:raffinose/stachyose/melibiose transport system substrate-binding protein